MLGFLYFHQINVEKIAIFTQMTAFYAEKSTVTLIFSMPRLFRPEYSKIAENRFHNIDPLI
jgi:flagellar assembly factor FliW